MDTLEETSPLERPGRDRKRQIFLLWLYPLLWLVVLFLLSTELGSQHRTHGFLFRILALFWHGVHELSWPQQRMIEFVRRKSAHFTEYAVFGVLLFRACRGSGAGLVRTGVYAWLILSAVAALDEFHQSFVPTRTPNPKDTLIDIAGGTFGVLMVFLWGRIRERRERERA